MDQLIVLTHVNNLGKQLEFKLMFLLQNYLIEILNFFKVENNGNQRVGTVRIFIAPRYDERGLPFLFREQRKLFVELDRFSVTRKYYLKTYC